MRTRDCVELKSLDPLAYYATQSPITDPGKYVELFADLPGTIGDLCRVVQGLCIHYRAGEAYGYKIPKERLSEIESRYLEKMLARILELDNRPLIEPRSLQQQLVGSCHDFAVLFCAMARYRGIPSHTRVGFSSYFTRSNPGFNVAHEIAEVWNPSERRWQLVDPELDDLVIERNDIQFDVCDVPRDRFLVAGQAWQMCRAGEADPNRFGIGHFRGLWSIYVQLVLDLAAQNKMEMLPWDGWGLLPKGPETLTDEEWGLLDRVAVLTQGGNEAFPRIQAIYEGETSLKVPPVIMCYSLVGEPYQVRLPI